MADEIRSAADVARAVDQAAESLHRQHQDDLTFVPEWGPLEQALPAAELGGWMFMNRSPSPHGEIISYKHGITRKYLHLDASGTAYVSVQGEHPENTRWSPLPRVPPVQLLRERGHYSDLEAFGAAPETTYDDDYRAGRNRALRAAGFDVIEARI